jgi:hypothetical protein
LQEKSLLLCAISVSSVPPLLIELFQTTTDAQRTEIAQRNRVSRRQEEKRAGHLSLPPLEKTV